jgi:hypothetical protein
MSKLKKQAEKLLKAIEFEPVPLSTKRGKVLGNDNCPNKVNSKARRHRGWVTARWAGPGKYKEAMLNDGLDSTYYYDDWQDKRDGQRDMWNKDKIYKIRFQRNNWRKEVYDNLKQLNEKLRKHERIRRQMRNKEKMRNMRIANSDRDKFIKVRRK